MTLKQRQSRRDYQAHYRAKKRKDAVMQYLADRLQTIPHSKYFELCNNGMRADSIYGRREFRFVESGKFMTEFCKGLPDDISWHGLSVCGDHTRLIFRARAKYVFEYADDGYGYYIRQYNNYSEYLGEEDVSWL